VLLAADPAPGLADSQTTLAERQGRCRRVAGGEKGRQEAGNQSRLEQSDCLLPLINLSALPCLTSQDFSRCLLIRCTLVTLASHQFNVLLLLDEIGLKMRENDHGLVACVRASAFLHGYFVLKRK